MADTGLMTIGAFATLAGVTASALRFYDDAGLLHPEQVDPLTGYRWYSEPQLVRASQLRQLREIGMPLTTIGQLFAASAEDAARLIDDHVATVAAETIGIHQTAARLKAALGEGACLALFVLPGPVLAAAIDQILATTVHNPDVPILSGVRLEVEPDAISLTATDRYRLAIRTLVPSSPTEASWEGTVSGEDLQATTPRLRRSPIVTVEAGERTLALRTADGSVAHCRLLAEAFPDFRLLVRSLPAVTHRLAVETQQLLTALGHAPERVGLRVTGGQPSLVLPKTAVALSGTATGPDMTIWFELTTLYPALSHALGSDLMIDLRGPDQPTTVRSADNGDLTSVVMPCRTGPS